MNRADAKLLPLAAIGVSKGLYEVYAAPFIKDLRPSTKAWLATLAFVGVYDVLSRPGETMSERYADFVDDHPAVAWGAVAITAAHLLDILPDQIDPIHNLAKLARVV